MVAHAPTVLAVDDDSAIRLLCRINLELDGCRVLEAASIRAARELLASERVDVVLLDVHVGGEDGCELLRDLRRDGPTPAVALVSGTAELDTLAGAGADALLPKPFTLDALRETVTRLAGAQSPSV